MTRVAKPGLPDLKVEIAPTATPFTASPTWVDITTDLRLGDSVTATRGRTDARSQAQPGTLSLTLNNPVGNYTPGLASGAYHPLKLRCPIRLSFKPPGAGAYTVMWTGLIDEYAPGWVQSRPIVTLQCSDRLSALNRVELASWETQQTLSTSPDLFFPLTDAAGSATVGDIAGNLGITATAAERGNGGSYDLGSGSLPVDDATVCAFTPVDASNGWCFQSVNGSFAAPLVLSDRAVLSCLMNTTAAPASNVLLLGAGSTTTGVPAMELGIGVNSSGKACVYAGFLIEVVSGTVNVVDGNWHHIAVECTESGSRLYYKLYVDGVQDSTTYDGGPASGSSGVPSPLMRKVYIGGTPTEYGGATGHQYSGQIAMCGVWDFPTALTADIISEGNAARTGTDGETSTARFLKLCDFANITGAVVGTGASIVARQKIAGQSILDALDDVGTAEQSPIYITGAGVPTLAARTARYGAAVALTIDATDVGADVKFTYNGDGLINDAKGTRLGGAEQRVTNATSIADHGTATFNETFILSTDAQMVSVLQWLTAIYGEPRMRSASLRIDGWVKQATVDLDDLLALEIGSRLQVINMPAQAPSSTLDLFAEGFSDVFNTNGWQRTINTSGAEPYVNVWILGDSTYSVLGTTTIPAL